MSTQDYPKDPLKAAALVPEDPYTEPPAGPLTASSGEHVAGTTATPGTTGGHGTKAAAKDEAREHGHESAQSAKQVAHTAKEEAGKVANEASAQVRNLVGELGSGLKTQAGTQQQKITEGLRSISDELRSMADNSEGGTAGSLVGQAAGKTGDVADWLDGRDPASLLDEVKDLARRRPGVFLAVAVGAGLLAGRFIRGTTGQDASSAGTTSAYTRGPSAQYGGTTGVRPPVEPEYPLA